MLLRARAEAERGRPLAVDDIVHSGPPQQHVDLGAGAFDGVSEPNHGVVLLLQGGAIGAGDDIENLHARLLRPSPRQACCPSPTPWSRNPPASPGARLRSS